MGLKASTRQGGLRALIAGLLCTVALPAIAQAAYTTLVNTGPSSNRVDIVFLGDGYTADLLNTTYVTHIDRMVNHLFNEFEDPYPRYRNFFNVHKVDVVSNQTGADVPPLGIFRDTALDATYYADGVTDRLLSINTTKGNAALATGLSGAPFTAEVKLVTVNDTRYGGAGGTFATYAGGNGSAAEIALHEMGHSFNRLADEYGGTGVYPGSEPTEINVTKDPTGAKWARWLGYNQPNIGIIGAYEGGRYYNSGIYRPSFNSKMRALGRPFDAIAREKIILDIYNLVNPLDSYTSNASTLIDPTLEVDLIDADVLDVAWSVNGQLVSSATDVAFNLVEHGFGPGSYSVSVRAYDPTDWVRMNLNQLEQTVNWQVVVTVPEPAGLAAGLLLVIPLRRNPRLRRARR